MLDQKKFWLEKNLALKICWWKKMWLKEIFSPKKIEVQKMFWGLKDILSLKRIMGQNKSLLGKDG